MADILVRCKTCGTQNKLPAKFPIKSWQCHNCKHWNGRFANGR